MLQQLESPQTQDVSVNDCFRPVSRYWDRIYRPEQLITALPEAMRVLTSPAETGAVTLALPQDTQAEAFEYPAAFFAERVWHIQRPRGDCDSLARAVDADSWVPDARSSSRAAACSTAKRPTRCGASPKRPALALPKRRPARAPSPWDHPLALGAIGVTGTLAANKTAREADLVIAIGTRLSDFTTMSKTAFANPDVRFVDINVCELDAYKHAAIPVVADARVALDELAPMLSRLSDECRVPETHRSACAEAWKAEVDRLFGDRRPAPFAQAAVIGAAQSTAPGPRTSSCVRPAASPAICTSCGGRSSRTPITSNTATRAWVTKSPAGLA